MKKIILILYFFAAGILAQSLTPIINLHKNDSNGIPLMLGQTVTISGIVTVGNQFGINGPGNVQDATGGITIYGKSFANSVKIGDSVTVTGVVDLYNGLTELKVTDLSQVIVHSPGHSVEPLIVTLADIKNQDFSNVEELEGSLVRINNVTIDGSGFFDGGTSGKNYNISDSTASLQMRIDESVNIVGTAIPGIPVDIIAVVGQYDRNQPYEAGYQILPRKIEDIVTAPTPTILSPVVISNVTASSFKVYFYTLHSGNSEVKYGTTPSLELGDVVINDDTTYHVVQIKDLKPITTYYIKAFSRNAVGVSESKLYSVTTSSSNPSVGTINVYFNFSVDHNVSIPGNFAKGNVDFTEKLVNRINQATYSIDVALYSFFGLNTVTNALIAAKKRGVKIRLVYDNRTVQSSVQQLLNAGIKMSQRPAIPGIMHDKFAVFDGRDSNSTNDWVWTGSWNWTSTELNWRNNVVEINDPSLAKAFTDEFEEMWGSNTDTPDPSKAKFGPSKIDDTPHSFSVGGTPVELYFSPSDNTETYIHDAIASADSSIYFAVYSFTSDNLFNIIQSRFNFGVHDVRGIISDVNSTGSEYQNLLNLVPNEIFDYNLSGQLHHKYGIIDASYITSDPIVITGSHNWSRSANEKNDENTLIVHNIYIANQFLQEFKSRYNELGGTTSFVVPKLTSVKYHDAQYPHSITLNQNYPNPFNPVTTITFYLPGSSHVDLSVYNLLGQKIKTLFDGNAKAGLNVFDFSGENLSSGVYFYVLRTVNKTFERKMLLLK